MARKGKKLEHGCLVKWRNRLEKARKRGGFTTHESIMAGSWRVCAVGEAHGLNPHIVKYNEILAPVDELLDILGGDFAGLVSDSHLDNYPQKRDFNKVETCLNRIEKRLEKLYTL